MSPLKAVRSALRKSVDFAGRARRAEFWWFFLAAFIAVGLAGALDIWVLDSSWLAYGPLELVTQLALLLPTSAVAVRRLHDTGRTGWWFAGWLALSLVGDALDLLDPSSQAAQIVVLVRDVAGFAATVVLIVFLAQRTRGPNRFGPPPILDDRAHARSQ